MELRRDVLRGGEALGELQGDPIFAGGAWAVERNGGSWTMQWRMRGMKGASSQRKANSPWVQRPRGADVGLPLRLGEEGRGARPRLAVERPGPGGEAIRLVAEIRMRMG